MEIACCCRVRTFSLFQARHDRTTIAAAHQRERDSRDRTDMTGQPGHLERITQRGRHHDRTAEAGRT